MSYQRHYEKLFGPDALKSLAEAWARLPRKDSKTRTARPHKMS